MRPRFRWELSEGSQTLRLPTPTATPLASLGLGVWCAAGNEGARSAGRAGWAVRPKPPQGEPAGSPRDNSTPRRLVVRRNGKVVIGGDGQVTLGQTVSRRLRARIRRLDEGRILAGFAGSAADGLTLFESLRPSSRKQTETFYAPRSNWPRTGAPIAFCADWRRCCWWPIERRS